MPTQASFQISNQTFYKICFYMACLHNHITNNSFKLMKFTSVTNCKSYRTTMIIENILWIFCFLLQAIIKAVSYLVNLETGFYIGTSVYGFNLACVLQPSRFSLYDENLCKIPDLRSHDLTKLLFCYFCLLMLTMQVDGVLIYNFPIITISVCILQYCKMSLGVYCNTLCATVLLLGCILVEC